MSVLSRVPRPLHEFFAVVILCALIAVGAWLSWLGLRWSGPYALATGVGATLTVSFLRPVRTRVNVVTDRIDEIVPSAVYWPAHFALLFAINLVDFPTGGLLDAVFTAGFSAMTTWLVIAIARALAGEYARDGTSGV